MEFLFTPTKTEMFQVFRETYQDSEPSLAYNCNQIFVQKIQSKSGGKIFESKF